ncbi:heat-stable enterotoxin receptor [Fundulus heteroclitus]|uniref:heat-stable enterotoxin receptor n=1 Tax=Fundulus heteroclitus TaxID=8078 RepID=UPI00165BD3B9|nr:heat-stable enterotoxin receptor [Fundulus heteroclitus]
MRPSSWWLLLYSLGVIAAPCRSYAQCVDGITINVILLEDEESPWSLKYVEREILAAIEKDAAISAAEGVRFNLTANFEGFNTTIYSKRGCGSSPCEAVEKLQKLLITGELGCAVLGPTCTFATFPLVDAEKGFNLSTPIISAGSFGPSCDYALNLQRVLPPARKISDFFINFWLEENSIKPKWEKTYLYKKNDNTEDCFWYINALEADGRFATNVTRTVLRKPEEVSEVLKSQENRTSNLFIICGSVADLLEVKNGSKAADSSEFLFILIDLYNDVYYTNRSSLPEMKNVLVLTMPNTREYVINSDLRDNKTMNDYMAAYHDSVLHIGQVMRDIIAKNTSESQKMDFVNVNYFRNTSFKGIAGLYKMDPYGDRDVNLSLIYTTTNNEYKLLFTFDTEYNETRVEDMDPAFVWGERLPESGRTSELIGPAIQNIIMGVLAFIVVVVASIAFIFYRQNRKDRRLRKRWSHINSDLIALLEDSEHNIISLKIEDERKKVKFQIRRALYDRKIVILKELKNSDGNFNKAQMIELNALLHIDYYNLTKFYGTVRFDEGVFGVFEYGERGSLRYVLNNKVSYPEDTFMDWEFKISVMYDIAKGMSYLHASSIQVHGRLKSTNCVVDNRMVVKITDFGCNAFLSSSKDLWTAPEHLRNGGNSQKGDVYSFAIISQEIIVRKNTFYTKSCCDRSEKLSRVMTSYIRPDLDAESASEKELEVYMLIKSCWDEDPEKRPDFKKVENCLGKNISKIHNQDNESYMDNMIRRLQNYSRNLEHLVEKRTALYKAERDRADFLNFMLLPGPAVKSLKETGVVEPELYDEVTIYFSDIVGFTTLCQYSTPMEVVDMLNDIYKGFDGILDHHDVYKVETIGDAYMVASGLPRRNGNRHAVDICRMALDILSFMGTFQLRHLPGIPVWIRIGVHSGPCAAGVVGMKMPRYCLFGDTVNTASRMESSGHPLRIHVSQPTIHILQRTDCRFEYETRGETYLKGKGTETTYWLMGETGEDYDLPTPPTTENVQRLQQDLAHMILACLERRKLGSVRRRKTVSSVEEEEEDEGRESEVESEDGPPEYLQLATVDNTLSTFL